MKPDIDVFIDRYSLPVARQLRMVRRRVRALFPRGYELVYDNYNALVFAFGPTEKSADAVLSVAAFPRWVNLVFLRGVSVPDPKRLLQGSSKQVRHLVLSSPRDLELAAVRLLIARALRPSAKALAQAPRLTTVLKSISPTRRPRRPATLRSAAASRGKR